MTETWTWPKDEVIGQDFITVWLYAGRFQWLAYRGHEVLEYHGGGCLAGRDIIACGVAPTEAEAWRLATWMVSP
ncbi:MAG TPA: hypothetical protein VGK73_31495 [Polyangiaceae bacterium]